MRKSSFCLLISFLFLGACAKSRETVFEDKRLLQEEEVRFCMIGDMGKDTPLQQEMAEALGRADCHRIFFLGDLIYPKGIKSIDDPQLEDKFLSYYSPLLDRDPNLEIGLILGNHDHGESPKAWLDVPKRYPGYFFPNYYYMIDYGGLCIVALDTSFYYYEKKVVEASQQSMWLARMQTRLKDCKVKVAITHHPFKGEEFAKGGDDWEGSSGRLKVFLDTYVIGRFDLHVAGHVHALGDDGKDEGTRMLISGTGGELQGPGRPGLAVLTWRPSDPDSIGYHLQYIDLDVTIEAIEEEEIPPEEDLLHRVIPKSRVEESWYRRLLAWLGVDN